MSGILDFFRGGKPEDRFAKRVMKRLQDRGWQKPMRYDRDRFALVLGDGDDGATIFLHNIFHEVSAAAATERDSEIDKLITFAFQDKADVSYDDAAPLLLPVIRSRFGFESFRFQPDFSGTASIYAGAYKPLCDVFVVLAAIDYPTSMKLVALEQLSDWSRSLDDILAVATENLRARSPCKFERDNGGFYISRYDDYYDASRILLPDVIQQLPLRGDPVAVVISRSGLVVAGSEDGPALDAMTKFVALHWQKETRPISLLPIVYHGDAWQPLDTTDAIYKSLDALRAKQHLWDYGEQKRLLEAHYEKQGRDVFVASLDALEYQGRLRTWTTWTYNAVSLLPEADVVILNPGEGRSMLVRPWTDIADICGPLELEPGTYPPRYLVEQSPGDAALRRLEAREHPSWFPPIPAKRP